MKTLREIIKEIGMTDKDTAHTYAEWYEIWFRELRNKPINLLEIGVCIFGGGCVLSLAEFFQNGIIWAAEIDKSPCVSKIFDHPRIKFLEEDAYNPEIINKFNNTKFEIIIDDGKHCANHQLELFKMLSPHLSDTGIYLIEDACTSHWLNYLKEIHTMNFQQTIVDMSTDTCYDNTLIMFKKRINNINA